LDFTLWSRLEVLFGKWTGYNKMQSNEINKDGEFVQFKEMNILSLEEIQYIKELLKKHHTYIKKEQCYANAQKLTVFSHGVISYVEGFIALNGKNKHAWNLINGKPFDISKDSSLQKELVDFYEGIIIPYSIVKKHFVEDVMHGYIRERMQDYLDWKKEVEEFERTRRS
jgi:hypothetical protein